MGQFLFNRKRIESPIRTIMMKRIKEREVCEQEKEDGSGVGSCVLCFKHGVDAFLTRVSEPISSFFSPFRSSALNFVVATFSMSCLHCDCRLSFNSLNSLVFFLPFILLML
uniref:Uncharacterized protein n=1 Tax=Cacopsylla melanoneura TaxID=428564 RepID=A0A8D9B553_9HEMI